VVKFCFAQNKKEQIEILNNRVDSLKIAFQNENSIKKIEIEKLESTSKELEVQKNNLQLKIADLNASISEFKLSNYMLKDSLNVCLKNVIELNSAYQNALQKMVELNAQLELKNKIEINPFVGSWFDDENCWISITEHNKNLKIRYHAGPCQGDLKGIFLKDKYELIHEYSACNFKGFNNDHILGKKIGFATIINGQLVLNLTIGDDLLKVGSQVFNRTEE
jgi:hypothetical protein